jgi:micrococcal nuclease
MFHYKAKCLKVVDGDTLDISIDLGFSISYKERVRLNGIDAPESRTSNILEKTAGLKVKDYLISQLEGKDIYIVTYKEEKYGRYLVDVYLNNNDTTSFNKILIDNGYVRIYSGEAKLPWEVEKLNQIISK